MLSLKPSPWLSKTIKVFKVQKKLIQYKKKPLRNHLGGPEKINEVHRKQEKEG